MKDLLKVLGDLKSTPGSVVRAHRTNFKITLRELSEVTGIAESHLSQIENDKVDLGVKRATLIAAALGIEPEFILFPNGYKPYKAEVEKVQRKAKKVFASRRENAA